MRGVSGRRSRKTRGEKIEPAVPADIADDAQVAPEKRADNAERPGQGSQRTPKYGQCLGLLDRERG